MKTVCLSALLVVFGTFSLVAQISRNCGTVPYLETQLAKDPGLASRMNQIELDIQQSTAVPVSERNQSIITIPVVFHVIYNTAVQNISTSRILAQLDVLNKDFSRTNVDKVNTPPVFQGIAVTTNIQFCLAQQDPNGNATTGILRVPTITTSFSINDLVKHSSSGGSNAWPSGSYLNIWVCNLGNGMLGYAQFPGGSATTDGVVVLYSSVGGPSSPGTAAPYHLGRTATHEVGHWLNLRHIWGDASCGNDLVSDTPTQLAANYGCPAFPHKTCGNGTEGDMFMNYMDYTDDGCMNMFTAGQASRITASINSSRASLLTSNGCSPAAGGGSCGIPTALSSTTITNSSATLNWTTISGATSYNVRYKTAAAITWNSTVAASASATLSGLNSSTTYLYRVQAVCGTTTGFWSASGIFTTRSSILCNDLFEANNSSSAAKTIIVNEDIGAMLASHNDVDWFKFTTAAPNTNFQLTLTNLPGDFDVRLYNSSLQSIATSQNGGTASEIINRNASYDDTYYVRVYGYNGAYNTSQCYKLHITVSSSPFRVEDNMSNADKSDLISSIVAIPNPASSQTSFEFLSEMPGAGTISVMDITGRLVYKNHIEILEGSNRQEINASEISNGLYSVFIDQEGSRRQGRFVVMH